jgi:hypothetical protein
MRASLKNVAWVIYYLVMAALSLFFLSMGVRSYFYEKDFIARAELVTGKIASYELHVRKDGKSEYCPRIEFASKSGEPIAIRGGTCPNQPDEGKIGQAVPVYFDPQNQNVYEEVEKFNNHGLFGGSIVAAVAALFFGLFWMIPLGVRLGRKKFAKSKPNSEKYRRY